MLYLKTSVKNGIISLYPLNPDEMYYKCEVCGNFYGIDNLSDFLKDYICPQCEAENEEDYELEQEEEFQSRIEKAFKMNNLIK